MCVSLQLYNDVDQGLAELVGYVERNSDIIDETQVIFLTSVVLSIFGDSLVSSDTSKVCALVTQKDCRL